jgi:hypothetical protein
MAMSSALRLVRQIQIAMLASVVLFAVAGERFAQTPAHNPANTLFHALSLISISLVGASIVVRRTLVLPAEALLQEKSDERVTVARWRTCYLALYAMCELLGVFGMVLRMAGFALVHVWSFYLGAILLLLLYSPRPPRA